LSSRHAWIRERRWARFGAVALPAAPVMGWAVWASEVWLAPSSQQEADLLNYILIACGMSAMMTLLAFLVFPARRVSLQPASPSASLLAARLPVRMRTGEIWALEAEDHYLRVHTSLGSALILMRLSDAIAELGDLGGAQTHRSWWVAKAAVRDARRSGERAVLTLANGVEAPVSRKYAAGLRRAGWF
jgi:DNA-binding LytR/AlgR family response regulator